MRALYIAWLWHQHQPLHRDPAARDATGSYRYPWVRLHAIRDYYMRHVVRFLRGYLREHWAVLRHAPIRDPVLGVLALIEKWGVDAPDHGFPEPSPQLRRERVPGRSLRGQDANPGRTV